MRIRLYGGPRHGDVVSIPDTHYDDWGRWYWNPVPRFSHFCAFVDLDPEKSLREMISGEYSEAMNIKQVDYELIRVDDGEWIGECK